MSRSRELHGIAGKVGDDLPDSHAITEVAVGNTRTEVHNQVEFLSLSQWLQHLGHFLHYLAQVEGKTLDREAASFDLGVVQNVVDHSEKRVAGFSGEFGILALFRAEVG